MYESMESGGKKLEDKLEKKWQQTSIWNTTCYDGCVAVRRLVGIYGEGKNGVAFVKFNPSLQVSSLHTACYDPVTYYYYARGC